MRQYKCKVCGKVFEVKEGETRCAPCARPPVIPWRSDPSPCQQYAGTNREEPATPASTASRRPHKYTYLASVAKKEGYEQMPRCSSRTAETS